MDQTLKTKKVLTLCIVHQHPRVLLAMKKRGFGIGKWNGLGGKVEKGETIEDAAKRECLEEAGIKVKNLQFLGINDFEFEGNPEVLEVHVFKATEFDGEPTETEEMRPQWYDIIDIPFKDMWPDDRYWMPLFLKSKKFRGYFLYRGKDIIDYTCNPL